VSPLLPWEAAEQMQLPRMPDRPQLPIQQLACACRAEDRRADGGVSSLAKGGPPALQAWLAKVQNHTWLVLTAMLTKPPVPLP